MNNHTMNLLRKFAGRSVELLIKGNVNDKDNDKNDENNDFNDNEMEKKRTNKGENVRLILFNLSLLIHLAKIKCG